MKGAGIATQAPFGNDGATGLVNEEHLDREPEDALGAVSAMASSKRVALPTASAIWSSVTRIGAPFGWSKSIAGNRCASLAFLADCSVGFSFLPPCPQRRPPVAPLCQRPPHPFALNSFGSWERVSATPKEPGCRKYAICFG